MKVSRLLTLVDLVHQVIKFFLIVSRIVALTYFDSVML